ncbi:Trm112 family protein [Hydromonas duriensis]|uniref:Uncharacterized protein n=1 Tax=Hydromonas duriensis TaxID=1527608 RepID=A0A4R6YBL5_9BURK|nr:Trm112 family protein [Hydromonas duriensis]TDR32991.1 hypothetical protein DFR44_10140 [Hydromonas duriensis]
MSSNTWLNALRCPKCKGELIQQKANQDKGATGLLCETDGLLFPIRDGMPILLIEQAISANNMTEAS